MTLPPCPHRCLSTSIAFPGQHKCNLKKILMSTKEAEKQCWQCEEQDFNGRN